MATGSRPGRLEEVVYYSLWSREARAKHKAGTKRRKRQADVWALTDGSTLNRQKNRYSNTDFLSGGLTHRRILVPSRPLSLLRRVARVSFVDDGAFDPFYLARVLARGRYPVRYVSTQICFWAAFLFAASGGCCAMRMCP